MASKKIRKSLTKSTNALRSFVAYAFLTCAINWGGEHMLNTLLAFISSHL